VELKDFPPVVYVPCLDGAEPGSLNVALRRTNDGRTALLAYSALDRLRAGAGDVPWALLTIADLQRVHDTTPYDAIYMDIRIPPEAQGSVPA